MYYNCEGGIVLSIENLDDMIKKYTEALETMGKTYGGEAEQMALTPSETANEEPSEEMASYSEEDENIENALETAAESPENTYAEEENDIATDSSATESNNDAGENELTSTASFSAAVFSGDYTYPVEGARIVIYRDDNIYAFLETDENGATKKITLPTFAEQNSLESDNPDRSVDYFADVFAEGFTPQKGLLVSGVGGSDIFLKVIMVPESERIG